MKIGNVINGKIFSDIEMVEKFIKEFAQQNNPPRHVSQTVVSQYNQKICEQTGEPNYGMLNVSNDWNAERV